MKNVQNYEFIECVVPQSSTGTRFYFQDQPQLRFVSTMNITCYTPSVVSASILSGNPLLSLANLQKTYLVLYYNDKESVNRIPVLELNQTGDLEIYVDGADEVTPHKKMLKGGGGALTREKIIAGASKKFVCIVDSSKCVDVMGKFPLPVEVLPLARSFVARELVKLGGQPELRQNYITDNHCEILDVHNLSILDPVELERIINNIPGVVTNGLFALRGADVVLVGKGSEVITY